MDTQGGWGERKPVETSLNEAAMIGWRDRRIMRLKETKSKIRVIRDHDNLDLNDMDLRNSRSNSCARFILFVNESQKDG